MLWERFATAIKSVGPPSVIVVANHSHPALPSTQNAPGFHFGICDLYFEIFFLLTRET